MGAAGLRALTSEYHNILDQLGRLYEECLSGPVDAALTKDLRSLDAAFAEHFAHERDLMDATRYPDAGRHEETHGMIRRFVDKLAAAAERQDDRLVRQELPFLLHLVLDHRTVEDRRLGEFVDGLETGGLESGAAVH